MIPPAIVLALFFVLKWIVHGADRSWGIEFFRSLKRRSAKGFQRGERASCPSVYPVAPVPPVKGVS